MSKRACVKWADSSGRVQLGTAFANRAVMVQVRRDEVVLHFGAVVPRRERWIYRDRSAIAAITRGLADAKARRFVSGPDLAEAARLVARR